jgi:integrase
VLTARLVAGPWWVEHDLVFPSEGGTVWDPRNARKRLRPVAAAALFPGSFHALRHAFATTAVAVLPSDAAVAKVLGHRAQVHHR